MHTGGDKVLMERPQIQFLWSFFLLFLLFLVKIPAGWGVGLQVNHSTLLKVISVGVNVFPFHPIHRDEF